MFVAGLASSAGGAAAGATGAVVVTGVVGVVTSASLTCALVWIRRASGLAAGVAEEKAEAAERPATPLDTGRADTRRRDARPDEDDTPRGNIDRHEGRGEHATPLEELCQSRREAFTAQSDGKMQR